jgi:hypothetical protein
MNDLLIYKAMAAVGDAMLALSKDVNRCAAIVLSDETVAALQTMTDAMDALGKDIE